jgi:hypothetical protein
VERAKASTRDDRERLRALLRLIKRRQRALGIRYEHARSCVSVHTLTGYAQDTRLDAGSTSYSGTPGTRLAIWPDSDHCEEGECVTLLYQIFNTSDLHYSSFSDNCGEPNSDRTATKTSSERIVLPVQTYGLNVKHFTLSKGAIAGIGCSCFLLLYGLALRTFFPKWKAIF